MSKLTNKQRAFVEHYLQTWNATEAARLAGYKGNENTLGSVGFENMQKPAIQSYIEKRIHDLAMGADEVVIRLSQQAMASIAEFIKPIGSLFIVDVDKVKAKGHLIKKIRYTKGRGVEIELHDSQAALVHLGRTYGLFTDKLKIEDWRTEAEERGIPAGELFEEMVKVMMEKMSAESEGAGSSDS